MTQNKDDAGSLDPLAAFREARDAYMDAWSKTMVEAVNTDAYAQAMGAWLDAYLTASDPLRKMLRASVTAVYGELGLPLRSDVTSLAERLTNIEMRLDDMDAKLDELIGAQRLDETDGRPDTAKHAKKGT